MAYIEVPLDLIALTPTTIISCSYDERGNPDKIYERVLKIGESTKKKEAEYWVDYQDWNIDLTKNIADQIAESLYDSDQLTGGENKRRWYIKKGLVRCDIYEDEWGTIRAWEGGDSSDHLVKDFSLDPKVLEEELNQSILNLFEDKVNFIINWNKKMPKLED